MFGALAQLAPELVYHRPHQRVGKATTQQVAAQLLAERVQPRALILLSTAPSMQASTTSLSTLRTMWGVTGKWGWWNEATLLDEDGAVARQYGVSGLPTTYFINRAGKIHTRILGEAAPELFAKIVREML